MLHFQTIIHVYISFSFVPIGKSDNVCDLETML